MSRPLPAIVAHRGARDRHPENTIRGLVAALTDEPRADGYECDLRLTRDGVPVVFHDADTRRLTGESGSVEERDLADLRHLRVDGEPIPTLEELLQATDALLPRDPKVVLNIELKPSNRAGELVDACRPILDPLAAGRGLVVSSFDPRVLAAARDHGAPWRLAFLYEELEALELLRYLSDGPPLDLHPDHQLVNADHLARLQGPEYGGVRRAFRVWTVDDAPRARELGDLGVEAIITNIPQRLKAALAIAESR